MAVETAHPQWEVLTCLASFFFTSRPPQKFCLVLSCPIFFHPLLTSSYFILLPRQNVRLLHLPHCPPPRVLPLRRAPLCPHARLASSHEDQLLWLYRRSAQVRRHLSKPVPNLTNCRRFKHSLVQFCCTAVLNCYLSWSRPVEEVVYNLVIAAVLLFDIVNIKEGATRQEFKGMKWEKSWKVQWTEDHKMGSKSLKVEEHILLHLVWTRTSWPCGSLVSCH